MIIHRLASAIRHQNWSQIITEILIVVIGIFLGLQVTAWNDARLERAQEQGYLARLHQEMTQSIALNNELVRIYLQQDVYVDTIMDSLSTCTLEENDKDAFASGLLNMGATLPAMYLHTVIDELKSTGKFQVIESEALRTAFSDYMRSFRIESEVADRTEAFLLPHIHDVKKQLILRIKDNQAQNRTITSEEIIFEFEEFCSNRDNIRSISTIDNYHDTVYARTIVAIERQKELLVMLEAEMEQAL